MCCSAIPGNAQSVCLQATSCPKQCTSDNDCSASGSTPRCCTDFASYRCTRTNKCPNQCTQSSDCNTAGGEACCPASTLNAVFARANLSGVLASNVSGLCVSSAECPKTCTTSQDCDTAAGQLCCNGFCARSCAKTCTVDNDCPTDQGQLCCTNAAISSPWWGFQP